MVMMIMKKATFSSRYFGVLGISKDFDRRIRSFVARDDESGNMINVRPYFYVLVLLPLCEQ